MVQKCIVVHIFGVFETFCAQILRHRKVFSCVAEARLAVVLKCLLSIVRELRFGHIVRRLYQDGAENVEVAQKWAEFQQVRQSEL